jgi:hypothetical protein
MDPLTAKEKESGLYTPPSDPRICFTGTLDDAQTFFQKTTPVAACKNCPISQWTDGLPVIIPTEDAVKKMLTGTTHKAEEFIAYKSSANITLSSTGIRVAVNKGDPMMYLPMSWGSTVEKIAVNAVMAGCKPNYLPVLLAAAESGGNYLTTNNPVSYTLTVAGPIVKELGINAKQPFHIGNPPLESLGRAYSFIIINIGGASQGSSNTNLGNPFNRTGFCVAEDADSLPLGWLPDNQTATYVDASGKTVNYSKDQSIVRTGGGATGTAQNFVWANFTTQAFLDLNQGKGPLARSLGVEGKPGKYNILQYLIPPIIGNGGTAFVVSPGVAQSLFDYGFKTKASIGQWLYDNTIYTLGDFQKTGWYDFSTTGGTRTIVTSDNKTVMMKDAPKDTPYHPVGNTVSLIVSDVGLEETVIWYGASGTAHGVDAWR